MTTQTKYRKYDSESDYYAMGYRMYSPSIGRFLSVDPLHELMPSHNPYHYAFNSPLVWKDPSGLAPEKDKNIHSEKLQGQFIKLRDLSTPIMPGDEYWVYIKDDRDFYFSAEYGGDSYIGALWHNNLSMAASLGIYGSNNGSGNSNGGFVGNIAYYTQGDLSIGPVGASSSKKPKTWDGKGFTNFFRKEINEISYLHGKNHIEYGFAAIWNHKKQEMKASELLKGKGDAKWFSLKEASDLISLEDGDVIVGFFHSHDTHEGSYHFNQFSFPDGLGIEDFGNLAFVVKFPNEYKNGIDLNCVFLGVVTPIAIQVMQVKNVENFLKLWDTNKPTDKILFLTNPNKYFIDNNFFSIRK